MSKPLSLQGKALGLLARREHTRAELAQKLSPHTEDAAELAALLDDLVRRGFQSDTRYAAEFVRAKSRRYGAAHMRYALREKGVAETVIAAALDTRESDELSRAQEVWQAKFSAPPASIEERGKQMRFLAGRGFSIDIIRKVLRGEGD